jgi:glycosyltransferase involved in cell wall biosynthesis
MLWFIPLEPLEERYTAQMYQWVIDGFKRQEVEYSVIYGDNLSSEIRQGEVLDAIGTNYYKASQLKILCKIFDGGKVKNGDIFFVGDLWFPGIEMIRYMAVQLGLDVTIAGIHYAGVFDPHDFTHKMRRWAQHNERGWLAVADYVFVGSEYHKKLLENWTGLVNIYATGLVWDHETIRSNISAKEPIIIFPHRLDMEKCPQVFFDLVRRIKELKPEVKGLITSSRKGVVSNIRNLHIPDYINVKVGLTKQQYYDELAMSKVFFSSAEQETFGYALNEALALGCIPICPRRLSYIEVLEGDNRLLYDTFEDAVAKSFKALDSEANYISYTAKYSKSVDQMLSIIIRDR